jgi:hypothetical protein
MPGAKSSISGPYVIGERWGCGVDVGGGVVVEVDILMGKGVSVGVACVVCGLQAAGMKRKSTSSVVLKNILATVP